MNTRKWTNLLCAALIGAGAAAPALADDYPSRPIRMEAVSYTHLDVYKRQGHGHGRHRLHALPAVHRR